MKQTLLTLYFLLLSLCCFVNNASAQSGWTAKDLFERRNFVENLGQFDQHARSENSKILFGSYTKGVHIYFTNSGIVFNHYQKVKKSRKEIREERKERAAAGKNKNEDEEERENYKLVPVYREMVWEGCNTNARVTTSDKTQAYHTYTNWETNGTFKAYAYKKLVYHDIYPNIDVEFYFPSDSAGFKYNYIVRKGGNTALIREHWDGKNPIRLQDNGDVLVETVFGNITSKKPVSRFLSGQEISKTEYSISNNVVSYTLNVKSKDELIIDPWLITPAFTSGSAAFDLDFDNAGNAYVYGGDYPYQVLKYDNAGTFLWSYTAAAFGIYYGDIAADQNSGSVYITCGYGTSPNVIKLWTSGIFVASHSGTSDMNEMWRISFSSCTNQAVIAGGGTSGDDQMCYLDTNLSVMTSINVYGTIGPGHDIALLTVDNYGSCYVLHANWASMSIYDNQIVKAPMPTFAPMTYAVSTSYNFQELSSPMYVSANGFNGLAVGDKSLYSYDSYVLEKRNATTGATLITKPVNFALDNSVMYWGGITVDDCQNLFFGSRDTVFQYDSLLNQVDFYPMPGTVYDLKIARTGILYVTGEGFVTAMLPNVLLNCSSPINPNLTVTNASCYTSGSASVNPTGGSAPYTVIWNTVPPQTGLSVTDLPLGSYTVTISDSSCNGNLATADFTITMGPGGYSTNSVVENVSCFGLSDGSITLSPTGGVAPYTYVWDTLGITDSSATGLGSGTYGITITDSAGCLNILNITIVDPGPISGSINLDSVNCFGQMPSLVCLPVGGTAPYTVLWNTSLPVLNDTLPVGGAGIYSITITDNAGCVYNFTDTVYEPLPLNLNLISQDVSCDGTILGSITANVTGGTGPYAYAWSNDPGNNTNVDPDLLAGVYTLTVTDDNGCTINGSDTIFALTFPAISFTTVQPCNDGSNGTITAVATGGTAGTTFVYSWNTTPVQTGLVANNVSAGTYILSVEADGCTFTFPVTINENAIIDTLKINGVICGVDDFVTLYLPTQAQPTYVWYNAGILLPGETGSSYNSSIPDAPFITASWFMGGCHYITTNVETDQYPVASTKLIPNVFSPNSDALNSKFYAFTFAGTTSADHLDYLFEDFSMQIFNRWGQLMFESNDPAKGWDGGDAPEGVYFVLLKYKSLCSDKEGETIYNGTVQLVR